MISPEERAIIRSGRTIVTSDTVTRYDAAPMHDCVSCNAWERAHYIVIVPAGPADYQIAGMCTPCANAMIAQGYAVDQRNESILVVE